MTQTVDTPNKGRRNKLLIFSAIALAAAVVIVLLIVLHPFAKVSPWERAGLPEPTLSEFREADEDMAAISEMMEKKDYEAALIRTEKALANIQSELDAFKDLPVEWEEDIEYDRQKEEYAESELRWTYIYLLLQAGRENEAHRQLNIYLKKKKFAEHLDDAQTLLAKIKSK